MVLLAGAVGAELGSCWIRAAGAVVGAAREAAVPVGAAGILLPMKVVRAATDGKSNTWRRTQQQGAQRRLSALSKQTVTSRRLGQVVS
jgi:hypothetical protein